MCEKVNRLKESIEEKAGDETVKYVFPPFMPDEEMNESYFLR